MPVSPRRERASTRSTSRSPDLNGVGLVRPADAKRNWIPVRLDTVVLFFEFMLVAAVVVITWFALYAVYRLISDES